MMPSPTRRLRRRPTAGEDSVEVSVEYRLARRGAARATWVQGHHGRRARVQPTHRIPREPALCIICEFLDTRLGAWAGFLLSF